VKVDSKITKKLKLKGGNDMRHDIKKIEKDYGKKSVEELIKPIEETYKKGCLLRYLKETERWKECPGYADKRFDEFLSDAIGMDWRDYDSLMYLFSLDEKSDPENPSPLADPKSYWRGKAKELELESKELKQIIAELKGAKIH
jgi:hypothetical protein